MQDKYRDEDRPRFGVLRGKEFEMLDGYSFSADQAGLDAAYDKQAVAYRNIFDRIGFGLQGHLGGFRDHGGQKFTGIFCASGRW